MAAHASNLERFPHFILEDRLEVLISSRLVVWAGRLYCQDGIEICIDKNQDVRAPRGRPEVRTREYSYHVLSRSAEGRIVPVLRYDNAHPHLELGHPDEHHKHTWGSAGEVTITHVGVANWPTLGDVIEEVERGWIDSPRT